MKITNKAVLVIKTENKTFYAALEDNPTAKDFIEKLSPMCLNLDLYENGGYEKAGVLPFRVSGPQSFTTAEPGDIVLQDGDRISVCYADYTCGLTRLARIGGVTKDELISALGMGTVKVKMNLEWDE